LTKDREIRVSDNERQQAASRLRAAHDEGRLDFAEYDRRLADAYSSVTYGDLDKLFVDLPAGAGMDVVHPAPAAPVPRRIPAEPAVVSTLPTALKVLWIIWGSVVLINLTVWLLVSIGGTDLVYFWPMWLAVPGVALVAVSAGVVGARGRADDARRDR
jgi:Domain of unknown function (DUF1707)